MTLRPQFMLIRPINLDDVVEGEVFSILMKYEDAFASVDPLGEALHFLRMSGIFYCRAEFRAP